jgi:hypothetical protein
MMNLRGQQFGDWTVLRRDRSMTEGTYWRCRCACGNERHVAQQALLVGTSKSCGRRGADPETIAKLNLILRLVADEFDYAPDAVRGPRRQASLVRVRHLAMWLCREEEPRASLPAIAKVFGHRDHTTVLHAIRVTEERMRREKPWRDLAQSLRAQLKRQPWFRGAPRRLAA